MERINVCLPADTLTLLDERVRPYARSQWLNYAALALVARLEGGHAAALAAVDYERAARLLMRARGR